MTLLKRHFRAVGNACKRPFLAVGFAPLTLAASACGAESESSEAASVVEHAVAESELARVRLHPDALRRLGVETFAVDSGSVAATVTLGGEVVIPPGQALTVSAPVAGTVLAPLSGAIPRGGSRVGARQPLMRLVALPADRDMAGTQQALTVSSAQLRQATAEAQRAEQLYADRLISARQVERARAELVTAQAAVEAATAQHNLVRSGDLGGLTALVIAAPDGGVVREVFVAPGQTVAAGAPLAALMRIDRLWVRVPVYAGDASRYARGAQATVHDLGARQSGRALVATPVAAPPSADPGSASVDLYYEVRDPSGVLRPGERVGVTLSLAETGSRALVVPSAAIVRDMNGGSWVYEQIDSLTFSRRRVEVQRVTGDFAVLALGPPPGTRVVTAGAAELFGAEFGADAH